MTYNVYAKDSAGRKHRFIRTGDNDQTVARAVMSEGFFPISITQVQEGSGLSKIRVSGSELLEITQTIGNMLRGEIPIKEAIQVSSETTEKPKIQDFYQRLIRELEQGEEFSQAWENTGLVTPALYLGMLKVGEKSGGLHETFVKLGDYLHRQKTVRDKVKNALAYPMIVLSVALIGIVLMAIFVLPQFSQMVAGINARAAAALGDRTNLMALVGWVLMIIMVLAAITGVTLAALRKRPEVSRFLSRLALGTPLIGAFIRSFNSFYLLFSLENLVSGGYPLDKALGISKEVLSNRVLQEDVSNIQENITRGESLSSSFLAAKALPAKIGHWVRIGEKTGQLGPLLGQLRENFQEDVENTTTRFINLVEPAIILLVGVVLILIIMNFIAPIFSMMGGLIGR